MQRWEGWTGLARKISLGMSRTRSIVTGTLYEKDHQQQWVNQERHKFSEEFPKAEIAWVGMPQVGILVLVGAFALAAVFFGTWGERSPSRASTRFKSASKSSRLGTPSFALALATRF